MRAPIAAVFGIAMLGGCGDNIGITPVPLVSGGATITLAGDNDRLIVTRYERGIAYVTLWDELGA